MVKNNKQHSPTHRVAKNSLWLIIQPLILNFISIFATAYIARMLGIEQYGKFIFAFAFVGMFSPLANMGVRSITVRRISEDKEQTGEILGKIITLRGILGLIAISAIILVINLMNYPQITRIVVYIASLSIFFQALNTTFLDVFQAHEKMKYVAFVQFISGVILTALSIIILFAGFRLVALTWVYVFGSFVALATSFFYMSKKFVFPKMKIDFSFWKESIYKGVPFFFPGVVALIGANIGIIILSKFGGDISVGIYGAANILVGRLIIIPDGIGTAIFPTMASLYKSSKEDAVRLFKRFFLYLFLLGLPIAVGATILARPIINLIYGVKYQASALILQILIWWLFFKFLTSIQSWTLGAIHQERKSAKVFFIAIPCGIILALFLVPHFKGVGIAISSLITVIFTFVFLSIFIRRHLTINLLEKKVLIKSIFANIIMAAFIFLLKKYNLFLSVSFGVIIYLSAILLLRIVSIGDLLKLWERFVKNKFPNGKKPIKRKIDIDFVIDKDY